MTYPAVDKKITFIRHGVVLYKGFPGAGGVYPNPWEFLSVNDVIAAGEGLTVMCTTPSYIGAVAGEIDPSTPYYTLVDA